MMSKEKKPKKRKRKLKGWKRIVFPIAAMILVPAFFLILAELILDAAGAGGPTKFFLKAQIDDHSVYVDNENFGRRFFPPRMARKPVDIVIPRKKTENVRRVFVLGGSAAQGDPEPSFSFGRILEVNLEKRRPEIDFEIYNCAMTGINSHVVLPIAKDCAELEPDYFLIYMGNNEVVGPYGCGTVFTQFSGSLYLSRFKLWLKTTSLGQAAEALLRSEKESKARWRGMAMFMENRVPFGDDSLKITYDHFEANLQEIVKVAQKSGAKVILASPAVNLRSWEPFASMRGKKLVAGEKKKWKKLFEKACKSEDAGEWGEAAAFYEEALKLEDSYAETHFRLGRCRFNAGEYDRAKSRFDAARDHDALRFRADSGVIAVIHEIARDNKLPFIDSEALLADKSPAGIPGDEFFFDHVHLNFSGNYVLARAFADLILKNAEDALEDQEPSENDCAEALAWTPHDRLRILETMRTRFSVPPFTNQSGHERRMLELNEKIASLRRELAGGKLEESAKIFENALERRPNDVMIRENYARLLQKIRRPEEEAAQWEKILALQPHKKKWRVSLGEACVRAGMADKALEILDENWEDPERKVAALNARGTALFLKGETERAASRFRQALELDPRHKDSRFNLARIYLKNGQKEQALAEFLELLALVPEDFQARVFAGRLLHEKGELSSAARQLAEALKIAPAHPEANYLLGLIAHKNGDWDAAETHLSRAARHPEYKLKAAYFVADVKAKKGDYQEAVDLLKNCLELSPEWPPAMNRLARIYAACPDEEIRDGPEALRLAGTVSEKTGGKVPLFEDVLAAAYAECGEFENAVSTAKKALDLARNKGDRRLYEDVKERLLLYENSKPFREKPRE